jgi:galactokinase
MSDVRHHFFTAFQTTPALAVASPGRINLIGEHTDYNHGFVLPAAIDKSVQVAIGKRTDGTIHMVAMDIKETVMLPIQNLKPHTTQWVNYVIGVVDQVIEKLAKQQNNSNTHYAALLNGFNITLQGNIPIGAGLSSSAAVECAVLFALNELYDLQLTKMEMAMMAQKAEHDFAGVKCGIMDMFASLFGQKNKVILLDCVTLSYQYYPFDLTEYCIVLFDTQIKHALASSEYNTRRIECEQGLQAIQKKYPAIQSWKEVNLEQVENCLGASSGTPSKIYQRCKYVVAEIDRVQTAVVDLVAGDMKAFGNKMYATHEGLSQLYEVSCPELDFLVAAVKDNENVIGARMMGGGFGGCTINIIKKDAVDAVTKEVADAYAKQTNRSLSVYLTSIEEGTHLIK